MSLREYFGILVAQPAFVVTTTVTSTVTTSHVAGCYEETDKMPSAWTAIKWFRRLLRHNFFGKWVYGFRIRQKIPQAPQEKNFLCELDDFSFKMLPSPSSFFRCDALKRA